MTARGTEALLAVQETEHNARTRLRATSQSQETATAERGQRHGERGLGLSVAEPGFAFAFARICPSCPLTVRGARATTHCYTHHTTATSFLM